jgi:hypothetical protein
MRRFLPIITLVLLGPAVAELLGGATQIHQIGLLVFYVPIYGAGALLIRELVRRRGLGWPSVLLLGAAYGIVEEGLALQSLFNPAIYGGVAGWGARVLGVNGVYAEVVIPLHAVWSVTLPILLTELLFPASRAKPYLGRLGLASTAAWYIIGVALVATSTLAQTGFVASPALLGLAALVVIALGAVALAPLRPAPTGRRVDGPPPWALLAVSSLGTAAFIGSLLLPGRARLPFMQGPLVLIPMACALIVAILVWRTVRRSAQSPDFGDRHLAALASGAVVAHTLCGDLAFSRSVEDAAARVALGCVTVGLLILLAVRVHRRTRLTPETTTRAPSGPPAAGPNRSNKGEDRDVADPND